MQDRACNICLKTAVRFRRTGNICRECEARKSREYYWAHREHYLEIMSKYQKEHKIEIRDQRRRHYMVHKERLNARAYKWVKDNSERAKQYRKINYVKVKARSAVGHAIKAGILTKQPCEKCGATKVQAHHSDYSQPLIVKWLCAPCHSSEHRNIVPLHMLPA